MSFSGHSIKQHKTVEYLSSQLDSKLSGEAVASRKYQTKISVLLKQVPNSCE